MAEQPWKGIIHGALKHPSQASVLLQQVDDQWQLPVHTEEQVWYGDVARINPAFSQQLGTQVWGLRQIFTVDYEASHIHEAIVELSLFNPQWTPPEGYGWLDRTTLSQTGLRPDIADALGKFLEEEKPPALRPPWAMPGWLSEIRAWIRQQVEAREQVLVDIQPVKQWGISCVMQVKTNKTVLYLKCTNRNMSLFVNEATMTSNLALLFPDKILHPFATQIEKGWMLLPTFQQDIYRSENRDALKLDMFRKFAELQIASIPYREDLLRLGALDRRLARLKVHVDDLIRDEEAIQELSLQERNELSDRQGLIHEMIENLAALGIPETLVHGDLHMGNAALMDGKIIFFDWTDACIAHPFFDLFDLSKADSPNDNPSLQAYFEPWKVLVSEDVLAQAIPLVRVLMNLHHAVSYQKINIALEPQSKNELNVAHHYLKDALEAIRKFLE